MRPVSVIFNNDDTVEFGTASASSISLFSGSNFGATTFNFVTNIADSFVPDAAFDGGDLDSFVSAGGSNGSISAAANALISEFSGKLSLGAKASNLAPMLQALHSELTSEMGTDNATFDDAIAEVSKDFSFMTIIGDSVVVDAKAVDGNAEALLADLQEMGLEYGAAFGPMVSGLLPIASIGALEGVTTLGYAAPSIMTSFVGSVTSQGDESMRADEARNTFGVDGSGLNIGVLSDSYDSLGGAAADITSGDLPSAVFVQEDIANGSDEGRAMLQLIFDSAPGASLGFNTAFLGQANFAQSIVDLRQAGADIIVDDVFYFSEPFFQDGIIAQAVDQVVADGALYFSSAGNSGQDSYESVFRNSGIIDPAAEFTAFSHDFDPGVGVDTRMSITIDDGDSINLSFQWDEPFSATGGTGSTSDLDIFLVEAGTNTIVASSVADNIANGDAFELLDFENDTGMSQEYELIINIFDGADPGLIKFIDFDGIATYNEFFTNSSTVVGHSNAAGALAIGASAFFNTPEFGLNPPRVNSFSSFGDTPIFFDTAGNRLASTEFRNKPDFTAPDGTNTTFFGSDIGSDADSFPNFFGTSAAAPHAAAAAALMLEAVPGATQAQVLQAIKNTAVDILLTSDGRTTGGAGDDIGSGAGLIQVDAAITELQSIVAAGNSKPFTQDDVISVNSQYGLQTGFNVFADNGNGADTDADGDPITVSGVNVDPANVGQTLTLAGGGLVTVFSDGSFQFDDNGAYTGLARGATTTDFVSYAATDGTAVAGAIITVAIIGSGILQQGNDTDEMLSGTANNDDIFGLGGNDIINGLDGSDLLVGGGQQDILSGGIGDDLLYGETGKDTLNGDAGDDFLDGGQSGDSLSGGDNDDLLLGGDGNDTLFGDNDTDFLAGQQGKDTLRGGAGNDTLYGDDEPGFETGDTSRDFLFGGTGNDFLSGGDGNDVLRGGGQDDELQGGNGDDGLFGDNGNDLLEGGAGIDTLRGGGRNDELFGGSENDFLFGGSGSDLFNGGTGDDVMRGDAGRDIFVFEDDFGNDEISDFDALANLEKIDLSAVTNITDFTDLINNHIDTSTGVVRIVDGMNSITLTGVNLADLDANDFNFVTVP